MIITIRFYICTFLTSYHFKRVTLFITKILCKFTLCQNYVLKSFTN